MATTLQPDQEAQFQQWIRALPWFTEFQQQYGEAPNLNDPDYDYRAAWQAGLKPERYAPDGGRYHWPSALPTGQMLKSEEHPTAWMEHFMREFGVDPNDPNATAGLMGQMRAERLAPENALMGRVPMRAPRRGLLGGVP